MADQLPLQTPAPALGTGPAARTCTACGGTYPPDFAVCPRDATPLIDRTAAAADPLIGTVLAGTYRISGIVGEGGMARLYEAEHVRLGRRCAIKVIHDDLARTPDLVARFEREARATTRIRSEHVVEVIDVVATADGRPCIVVELLEGEDLQAYLDRVARLSPAEAIPLARQICRALEAAHQCGVVHRDLKPSNVFLCKRDGDVPLVKVLDFGVAKLSDAIELTQTGAVVGTPTYMAPEQAKRASQAGPLADVYTVGAVLYRMVTGEPPYGHDPPVNPLMLLLYEEPARPRALVPSLPEGIEAVIQHAMARDPEARPQSIAALDAELAAFDAVPRALGQANTAPLVDAADITRGARLARPMSMLLAVGAILSAGLVVAALIGALSGAPRGSERVLIGVLAGAASLLVGVLVWRTLRARWRNGPAVLRFDRSAGRTLLAGLAALGALELVAHGGAVLGADLAPRPFIRLALALVAAGLAGGLPHLVTRKPRRED